MPDSIRHPEKPASLIRLDSAEKLHFVPGLRPLVVKPNFEENTSLHAGKAVATEESRVYPGGIFKVDLEAGK